MAPLGNHVSSVKYEATDVVQTTKGPIIGRKLVYDSKPSVNAFLGIPYAKPPVAKLRFKKPEPTESWTKVLSTVEFGASGIQIGDSHINKILPVSEDNLTVNVFSPSWDPPTEEGFPVLFYIHGGGFVRGSSAMLGDTNIGEQLVSKDVIVVTIQYRLGLFGYWTTGCEKCLGNWALWDATLALEWVQHNISAFGGNRDNVTVVGHSSAGGVADLLSLSPHSRDLFHKVIILGGTASCKSWSIHQNLAEACRRKAVSLGVNSFHNTDKYLKQLRDLPAEALAVAYMPEITVSKDNLLEMQVAPRIDGDFLPKTVAELRKEAPPKPRIYGVCKHDGLMFADVFKPFDPSINRIEELISMLVKEVDYPNNYAEVRKKVMDNVLDMSKEEHSKEELSRAMVNIYDDYFLFIGAQLAVLQSLDQVETPSYLMTFDYFNPDMLKSKSGAWPFIDAAHCAELPFLFGTCFPLDKVEFNETDRKKAVELPTYFTNFCKTGNPNSNGFCLWSPADKDHPQRHLVINKETAMSELFKLYYFILSVCFPAIFLARLFKFFHSHSRLKLPMFSAKLDVEPFQTGRFSTRYTNVSSKKANYELDNESDFDECLLGEHWWNEQNDSDSGEPNLVLFSTSYKATNSNGVLTYITELKRSLSRKIDAWEYGLQPDRALSTCGQAILKVLTTLVQSDPLFKDSDVWLELTHNSASLSYNDNDISEDELLTTVVPYLLVYVAQTSKSITESLFLEMSRLILESRDLRFLPSSPEDNFYFEEDHRPRQNSFPTLPQRTKSNFSHESLVKELDKPHGFPKIECFEKLKLLGKGAFGDVFLARHKYLDYEFAIKVIKNYKYSPATTKKLLDTLKVVEQFLHTNIVRHYDSFTSDFHHNWITETTEYDTDCDINSESHISGSLYATAAEEIEPTDADNPYTSQRNHQHRYTFIVLEACTGSLHDLLNHTKLSEEQCIEHMTQIIEGLYHLNYLGFMHRDLKPQNILISASGCILLSDLDTVKRLGENDEYENIRQTIVRTPAYVSPEVKKGIYNERIDYYSLGVTFAQMLSGEPCEDVNMILNNLHEGRLVPMLHPQYAFLIRWLTDPDPTRRIGFQSFTCLVSMLHRSKYTGWQSRAVNSYSILLEHQETGEIMNCVRVTNNHVTVSEIVKRYSQRDDKKPKVSRRNSSKTQKNFRIGIRTSFEFEAEFDFESEEVTKVSECIELQNGRLVLTKPTKECVYICYSVTSIQFEKIYYEYFNDWIRKKLNVLTRWGIYSVTNISKCPFRPNCFIIEPNLIDSASSGQVNSPTSIFWPPEKMNGNNSIIKESGAVFSFGIFLYWSLGASEDDIIPHIRELQRGKWFDATHPSEVSQLISWYCAYDPESRPLIRNLEFHLIQQLDRSPTADRKFLFKLNNDGSEHESSSDDIKCILTKSAWESQDIPAFPKLRQTIYAISNRTAVLLKVQNRLKISGDFRTMPRNFVKQTVITKHSTKSAYMLDTNKDGELIVVPRNSDAVDWVFTEMGQDYAGVRRREASSVLLNASSMFQRVDSLIFPEDVFPEEMKRIAVPYIHSTFINVLKSLTIFHKQGLYHGNINFNNFLLSKEMYYCLPNPILIERDNDFCTRKDYLTEYSSPEQRISHIGSPASDVFSLGVTLYAVLCYHNNIQEFNLEMFQSENVMSAPDAIEKEYWEVIRKMTCFNEQRRIGCKEALKMFTTTCKVYAEQAKDPQPKHHVDNSIKHDYMLKVSK